MLHHGGKLRLAAEHYQIPLADWLDLSTGINPEGYPVGQLSADCWQRLPEDNDGLEVAAAGYYDCRALLPVAGSQAAIQMVPELFPATGTVLLPRVGYKEHQGAWQRRGFAIEHYDRLPSDEQISRAVACVVINPNNPSGDLASPAQLLAIYRRLQGHGGWLVVDEAFGDALPQGKQAELGEFTSLLPHIGLPGLVVLRGVGKFFGLAGARVGFLFAEARLLEQARAKLGPWTVAGPSRECARMALQDTDWQQQTRQRLAAQAQRLSELLSRYLGPSRGSWLFRTVQHPRAPALFDALCRQGILVRLCDEGDALRFGLPADTAQNWQRLAQALAAVRIPDNIDGVRGNRSD